MEHRLLLACVRFLFFRCNMDRILFPVKFVRSVDMISLPLYSEKFSPASHEEAYEGRLQYKKSGLYDVN